MRLRLHAWQARGVHAQQRRRPTCGPPRRTKSAVCRRICLRGTGGGRAQKDEGRRVNRLAGTLAGCASTAGCATASNHTARVRLHAAQRPGARLVLPLPCRLVRPQAGGHEERRHPRRLLRLIQLLLLLLLSAQPLLLLVAQLLLLLLLVGLCRSCRLVLPVLSGRQVFVGEPHGCIVALPCRLLLSIVERHGCKAACRRRRRQRRRRQRAAVAPCSCGCCSAALLIRGVFGIYTAGGRQQAAVQLHQHGCGGQRQQQRAGRLAGSKARMDACWCRGPGPLRQACSRARRATSTQHPPAARARGTGPGRGTAHGPAPPVTCLQQAAVAHINGSSMPTNGRRWPCDACIADSTWQAMHSASRRARTARTLGSKRARFGRCGRSRRRLSSHGRGQAQWVEQQPGGQAGTASTTVGRVLMKRRRAAGRAYVPGPPGSPRWRSTQASRQARLPRPLGAAGRPAAPRIPAVCQLSLVSPAGHQPLARLHICSRRRVVKQLRRHAKHGQALAGAGRAGARGRVRARGRRRQAAAAAVSNCGGSARRAFSRHQA